MNAGVNSKLSRPAVNVPSGSGHGVVCRCGDSDASLQEHESFNAAIAQLGGTARRISISPRDRSAVEDGAAME